MQKYVKIESSISPKDVYSKVEIFRYPIIKYENNASIPSVINPLK